MRLNKYIAFATGLSRRAADTAITNGRVLVNGKTPDLGYVVAPSDSILLDNAPLTTPERMTIVLNKPVGFVCSRQGQGSKTVYDLLPAALHNLKPIGRLDKDSSGLILLTNDGDLAQSLTHPRYQKKKIYEITLNKVLTPLHRQMIQEHGVMLDDGVSQFAIEPYEDNDTRWRVILSEGRNRQIRRTFDALGYRVKRLHRVMFGPYTLDTLSLGAYRAIKQESYK